MPRAATCKNKRRYGIPLTLSLLQYWRVFRSTDGNGGASAYSANGNPNGVSHYGKSLS